MNRLFALALAAALPALASAETRSWSIDPAHSDSQFAVRHLVVSTVRGHFGKTTGTIVMDDADLARSSVQAVVDVGTIDTRVPDRDAHLKSPDFFDAARHPTMTFRSTKVVSTAPGKLSVTGDLTIKGTTKPTVFEVSYSQPIKDPMGKDRRGFSASAKINRQDFGLNWSKMVEAGPVVGDEVQITIDAEAFVEKKSTATTQN